MPSKMWKKFTVEFTDSLQRMQIYKLFEDLTQKVENILVLLLK